MNRSSRLRVRHLEAFAEVARLRSVSRAAEALNLTQPAVTRTIRELEAVCGAALVERDGRGIRLTSRGEVFLRHAGASLSAMRNAMAAVGGQGSADSPPVRVGALPTVSSSLIPDAAALYLALGSGPRLWVTSGEPDILLARLRAGGLDLLVGRLPAPEDMQGLTFEPLTRDQVAFVVRRDHALAGTANPLEAMAAFPVLLPPENTIIRPLVDRLFLEHGIRTPSRVIETVSGSFGRAFVRRHDAVWVISLGVVASQIASGEFRTLDVDTGPTLGAVGLTTRAGAERSAAADLFVEGLRTLARRQDGSERDP